MGGSVLQRIGGRLAHRDQHVADAGFGEGHLAGDGADVIADQRYRGGEAGQAVALSRRRQRRCPNGPGAVPRHRRIQVEPVGEPNRVQQAILMVIQALQPDPGPAVSGLTRRIVQRGQPAAVDERELGEIQRDTAVRLERLSYGGLEERHGRHVQLAHHPKRALVRGDDLELWIGHSIFSCLTSE